MREISVDCQKINTEMQKFPGTPKISNSVLELPRGAVNHIKKKHYEDWEKHIDKLQQIISEPDYIGRNPNEENDIEFYKEFFDSDTKEVIFVAVRCIKDKKNGIFTGQLKLSTLYILDNHEKKIEGRLNQKRIVKCE